VKSASDNCLVVGVDVFKQYIKKAKLNNRDARVEFLVADGQHIPFRSKSFDFVICKDILHHIRHPSEALREISRVSLGEIVIIEANKYNLIMLLNEKYGNHRHLTVQQLKRFAYCFHVDSFSLKQVDAYPITLRLQSFKPMACVWNAFISIFLIACNKVPYFAEFGIRSFSSILVPSFNILTATIV
jgi:ubiquinone/menaquinone biosynthesis C-methylase UbiE